MTDTRSSKKDTHLDLNTWPLDLESNPLTLGLLVHHKTVLFAFRDKTTVSKKKSDIKTFGGFIEGGASGPNEAMVSLTWKKDGPLNKNVTQ